MYTHRHKIRDAVRQSLSSRVSASITASVAASLVIAPPVMAEDDDTRELERVEVTGSRIKRLDIEGPSPVTIISREQLDNSGNISVADVLRESTFNSFGSFAESSGFTAQSQATISLRGVGANRTLVLLDGRRMANSAIFAAGGGGNAQNLNLVPLAAVERIEILRDGASAIYGTDAIGGVVNIILRDDYEGLHFDASYGRSSWGEPDESTASVVGGVSGGKGNITFSLDHQERGMFFDADRPWSDVGLSFFGYPGTATAFYTAGEVGTTFTTRTWGTGTDTTTAFVGPGVTALNPTDGSFWFEDPRCPAQLGTDPDFPNSVEGALFPSVCNYNYSSQSATQASLKRDSVYMDVDYEISDNITAFGRVTVSHSESFGRYAPAPNTFYPSLSADNAFNISNPNNPNFAASDFNQPPGTPFLYNPNNPNDYWGPFDLSMLIRMVPNGPRDSIAQDRLLDVLVGLEGYNDWFGGAEWEVGYTHARFRTDSIGTGYGIHSLLQNAIDAEEYDPFGPITPVGGGGTGDTGPFAHTIINDSEFVKQVLDGQLSFDLFDMANGPVPLVVGFEYTDDVFHSLNDAQSVAGNVFGTAGGNAEGARWSYAVYGETVFPVMDNMEIDLAWRYDKYSDFGDTLNPKIAWKWTPMDNLLVRASYGTGFAAPDLAILNAPPSQSFPSAVDLLRCSQSGDPTVNPPVGSPCATTQYETAYLNNPNLDAEESENFSAGVVWNPTDDLDVGLTWYNIELTNQIASVTTQQMFILEQQGLVATDNSGVADLSDTTPRVVRNPISGAPRIIIAPALNLSGFKTSGYDLDVNYRFGIGDIGEFEVFSVISHVSRFDTEFLPGSGFSDALGFSAPDLRASLGLNWSLGDFGATLNGNYISDSTAVGTTTTLGSYTTWDVQFRWATPWDGQVVVGARNLFDREPPQSSAIGHPQWSRFLHDALGRVPFIRYEQDL